MSQSNTPTGLNRRLFIGAAAAASLAGGLAVPKSAEADPPSGKSKGRKPMRPAPALAAEAPVTPPPLAALVLNKAAYGPRPGDIEAFNALGASESERLDAWLFDQLNPSTSDPEVDNRLDGLLTSEVIEDQLAFDTIDKSQEQLWIEHARSEDYAIRNRPVWQMERLTLLRAAYSQWQLREVLYDFWFNHFNVYGREFPTSAMTPEYDRVLRQYIFGNFGDMLKANARTASMLYYLDNYANTWPNPNENYAREVLELHTLGAVSNYFGAIDPAAVGNNSMGQRAGYTEIDVFEFAKALTGWGVSDTTDDSPDTGAFIFRPGRHYDDWQEASIKVMDIELTASNGTNDVDDILDYLAGHYGTAEFIAWKLCTRLIGDNPPQEIVDSTALEFFNRRNDADQLKAVYSHILKSSAFQTTWGKKVARPVETLVRGWRASGVDLTMRIDHSASNGIWGRLDDTGHYPFGYAPPTGFPDERAFWQGTGPLIMSWRALTYMLRHNQIVNQAAQTNDHYTDPTDRTAVNIVSWWTDRALGYGLPAAVSGRIVDYVVEILMQREPAYNGDYANDPFDAIGIDTTPVTNADGTANNSHYQRIVRGLVGLILMSPEAMRR
ncbi:MAG: DUF1800 domain-containing protein [Xanthomonadales bacterium]|nr:DUF1800 domain-containing protein [Gammaproteobacteria bacterium]MBT8055033.1 DUF1800 domain-containing protein [Gammaproteobacteria bacterium]NND57030.1 DUF1800 domain-containing protein [Xanthomonadales bacterium]